MVWKIFIPVFSSVYAVLVLGSFVVFNKKFSTLKFFEKMLKSSVFLKLWKPNSFSRLFQKSFNREKIPDF